LAGEQDALLPELQASFLTQYIVNVEAAILHEGRYLIIQRGEQETHAAGALTLPGGKVEKAGEAGQILETTLRREILEEVGLEIQEPPVYLESNSFVADDREPVIDIVFLCRYQPAEPVAEPRIADPGEVAAIHWMRADQIFQNPKIPPWTRQSIHLAEQKRAELGW
jgi:ADP-ribose pyrophosphatase YjhB (NUDIX family)